MPGLFVAQGLEDVQVYVNDKATAVFRPYATAAQRAFTEDVRDRAARRLWNWSESEARRLFVAGGGSEGAFAAHYARGLASRDAIVRGLDDASYHGIIGGEFYLVAGRKPVVAPAARRPRHGAHGPFGARHDLRRHLHLGPHDRRRDARARPP